MMICNAGSHPYTKKKWMRCPADSLRNDNAGKKRPCLVAGPVRGKGNRTSRVGFTLIELLVVVLIIGILAAVALPKYQAAVLKSRFAAMQPVATSLRDAQNRYLMSEGKYAQHFADLDVQMPGDCDPAKAYSYARGETESMTCRGIVYILSYYERVSAADYKKGIGYDAALLPQIKSTCVAWNTAADAVCKSMGGRYTGTACREEDDTTSHGCNVYALP